jgi:hypothetical protein
MGKSKQKEKGSVERLGVVDLARANLLRRSGLKITPALREYYRYTGISAEVEKHGIPHVGDRRFQAPYPQGDEAEKRPHE